MLSYSYSKLLYLYCKPCTTLFSITVLNEGHAKKDINTNRDTDTYPKWTSWAFPCELLCRRTPLPCLGWRARVWSGDSASSPQRPGQFACHWESPLHSSAGQFLLQVGGSRSHDRWVCWFSRTLLVCGCKPEPWVELQANRKNIHKRTEMIWWKYDRAGWCRFDLLIYSILKLLVSAPYY